MGFKETGVPGKKLKWYRLEDYECPQCVSVVALDHNVLNDLWVCSCGFKISNEKIVEIISSMDEQFYSRGF